jgi:hypothetical protein
MLPLDVGESWCLGPDALGNRRAATTVPRTKSRPDALAERMVSRDFTADTSGSVQCDEEEHEPVAKHDCRHGQCQCD